MSSLKSLATCWLAGLLVCMLVSCENSGNDVADTTDANTLATLTNGSEGGNGGGGGTGGRSDSSGGGTTTTGDHEVVVVNHADSADVVNGFSIPKGESQPYDNDGESFTLTYDTHLGYSKSDTLDGGCDYDCELTNDYSTTNAATGQIAVRMATHKR